jgi:hypothetical protein
MNRNERSRGQDEQNQEQKGCRMKGNKRSRGQNEQKQEKKSAGFMGMRGAEGRMNQKGRVTGQDKESQEQKGLQD